ncbi:MAG: TonB-dependent receptor [Endomicrobia bacterium]|nr:TonB-dependent receptor [Endomicrobiia bacterium]
MSKLTAAICLFIFFVSLSFAEDGGIFLSLEKTGRWDFIAKTAVDEEEIENKNTVTALEMISSVPGVFAAKAASQIKTDISIRGIGDSFRKIGLFIDGRPEKMSVYGCGVSQTLLAGNVESIEIIKGPDSVLYGGDALGGVVNIKTKYPKKPFEGEGMISYGAYNTHNSFMNAGGAGEKFIYQLSVNKASSDGHLPNSGYDTKDYYGKFGYRIDDESELIFSGKYFEGDEFEPEAVDTGRTPVGASWYNFKRGGADARYKREFAKGNMEVLAFGDWGEHLFFDNFHSKDSLYGVFAHFTDESFTDNVIKYGAQYRLATGKVITGASPVSPTGEWKKSEFALFALDEYAVNERAKLFAGARYNYDEISGSAFVPRAGFSYDLTKKLNARAVYSRGFRSPYINELYCLPISNKDLKEETADSYEIGLNSKYLDIVFDFSGFIVNGDNIMQVDKGKFQNSGSYVFKGAELSAQYEIAEDLKVFAGYSYLDPGDLTQGIAKNKIDLSLDYKIRKFSFYAGGMFICDYYAANDSTVKLDDFSVFNVKIHYNINDNFIVFAAADNFTDKKYEMFTVSFGRAYIYDMPGAAYTFGAKYKF